MKPWKKAAPCSLMGTILAVAMATSVAAGEKDKNVDELPKNRYDGVDILLVVDDSYSMMGSRQILATKIFSLISALAEPLPGWAFLPVNDIRVGVINTDVGLMYSDIPGPNGIMTCLPAQYPEFITPCPGCVIELRNGEIPCEANSHRCPIGWECVLENERSNGTCYATRPEDRFLTCANIAYPWAELNTEKSPAALASDVACRANASVQGCGIEQTFSAAISALARNPDFLRHNHLLAVLVVSDEDDCSIKSRELFNTPEWNDKSSINIACGMNPQFLIPVSEIKQQFISLKDGDEKSVLFAAITGVPPVASCEGSGIGLSACANNPAMENKVVELESNGKPYYHFANACVRNNNENTTTNDLDSLLSEAKPGLRHVELAKEFGERGWIYSICNDKDDWSDMMHSFANGILRSMQMDDQGETGLTSSSACSVGNIGKIKSSIGLLSLLNWLL
jgi:uncharacterized ParB-like nuclease family protein